jgi:hypothetical protein
VIDFEVKGAVFDLDDTLLDNKHGAPGESLHERSQIEAFRSVGEKHGIKELELVSVEASLEAFLTAPSHTHEAAIWNMFV